MPILGMLVQLLELAEVFIVFPCAHVRLLCILVDDLLELFLLLVALLSHEDIDLLLFLLKVAPAAGAAEGEHGSEGNNTERVFGLDAGSSLL